MTMLKQEKTNVIFSIPNYPLYDIWGDHFYVAEINAEQFNKLKSVLEATENIPGICANRMHVEFNTKMNFNKKDLAFKGRVKSSIDFTELRGRGRKSPCPNVIPASGEEKYSPLEKCAKNFEAGKCQCPFMADVVGVIVLPHLYKHK